MAAAMRSKTAEMPAATATGGRVGRPGTTGVLSAELRLFAGAVIAVLIVWIANTGKRRSR